MNGRTFSVGSVAAIITTAGIAALILLFATMALPSGVPKALATTATPAITPTPTPPPPVDFSIGAGPDLGASNACDSSGSPTTVCHVPEGSTFKVAVYLNTLPAGLQGGKYFGFDARLQYAGVTQDGTNGSLNFTPWPDCSYASSAFLPGSLVAGCAVGVSSTGSAYTGRLMTAEFHCTSDGTITLVHGTDGNTDLVDGTLVGFSESGSEALSVDCDSTPVPTPTPGPPGVDFSIGITDVNGTLLCDSSGTPASTCDIPLGAPFAVDVVLHSMPSGLSAYLGYDAYLGYSGLTLDQGNLEPERWPNCYFDVYYADADHIQAGCAVGIAAPASTYLGVMTRVHFACDQAGTLTLKHGTANTDLVDESIQMWAEPADEELTINCVAPLGYPADSDADSCPDAREATTNAMAGGRRNFYNEWDYFNPTHDHMNRIDDVLAVVDQYFIDQGSPMYTDETDRTFIGPHGWNLGPPDGRHRIDDVVRAVHQYFHDCS